ncbi:hypothetical protein HERIO_898 [Hepatospora eriocheir]|uniref:Uncharacterized protein n=1 Tax=Hepatospora eriocheir TaxID=1081669 RepID=A0A1X0QBU8_9MICR|nr:hypothetical protein HERIO_898 [Hepatospora eriocheir]
MFALNMNNNLERLINSIKHEANLLVDEINKKKIITYNEIKQSVFEGRKMEIIEITNKRKEKLLSEYKIKKSKIKLNFKRDLCQHKNEVLNKIKNTIKSKLTNTLSDVLIKETYESIDDHSKYTLFCNFKFKKEVKSYFKEINIKELPNNLIGGLILIRNDGKVIIDNSYLNRFNIFMEKYLTDHIFQ